MSADPGAPASADPLVGVRVGEYQIDGVLGRGGMGVVYRAEDTALGIPVALKSIGAAMATDASFVRRFRTEARAMARVASPHIVRVMALRETEHGLFIVMEYVDGGDLHARMANGPIEWAEFWPLFRQMLLGLEAAHTVGVVHRDIKPRNVLLTKDDTVKLTDFGLARLTDSDATRTQAVAGTLAYMSPEQIRSLPSLDHRSDLFSLALTAYEALAGRLPFDRDGGDFAMMRAIVEDPFPPITEFREGVPGAVEHALMRALEKDPDTRYQTAAEMREAFAAAGDDATPTLTRVPGTGAATPKKKKAATGAADDAGGRSRTALVAGLATLALVAVAAVGYVLTRPGTLQAVPAEGVRYFLDDEPFEGEAEVGAGTYAVRCLARDISATAEVEVGRGERRRIACHQHDQIVDVRASWEGTAIPATVEVDGGEPETLPVRISLSTGRHVLRVRSERAGRIDSTVTVDVRPRFDPEPPEPVAVAIRGGVRAATDTQQGDVFIAGSGGPTGGTVTPPPATIVTPPPSGGTRTVTPPPVRNDPPPTQNRMGTVEAGAAPGLTLSLDGSRISNGSQSLRPGTYTAQCSGGGLTATTRVTVTANQRSPLRCYAPSQAVRVTVTSTDAERPWMSVVVDGQPQGQTPTQVTLPVGRHSIFVRRRGYEVVGQDMVNVDVPPRFTPDSPSPVPLSFQVRAAQTP